MFSQANVLVWYAKKTKPNPTKGHIHQSKEMYYNTKWWQKLKPGLVAFYDGNRAGLFSKEKITKGGDKIVLKSKIESRAHYVRTWRRVECTWFVAVGRDESFDSLARHDTTTLQRAVMSPVQMPRPQQQLSAVQRQAPDTSVTRWAATVALSINQDFNSSWQTGTRQCKVNTYAKMN